MNTVELSSIPNSIPEDLENTMINIVENQELMLRLDILRY